MLDYFWEIFKKFCIITVIKFRRLVLLSRAVGTAKLFMDILPVKLEILRENCAEKNISLKHPCIPTLSGRIRTSGGDKTGTKQARMSGLIIQMVGEDKEFG